MVYRGVLVYGASGTGKSSLINAGLLPTAAAHGLSPERIRVRPDHGQEVVIERIESDDITGSLLPSIFVGGQQDPSRAVLSLAAFEERLRAARGERRPLLIFDQFEEILTLFDERNAGELRAEIVTMLVRILREPIPVKFVFSLREEYLGRVTELLAACPELVDQSLRLAAARPDVLPQIIRGPFEQFPGHYPRELSPELAARLETVFAERSGAGELSLSVVQLVCLRLWESDDPDTLLDDRGIQGIMEDYLGAALMRMPDNVQAAAVALLSEMITSAGTRAVVSHDELMNRIGAKNAHARRIHDQALQQLVDESRLVRREPRRESFLYELTSEFLVPWISGRREELERRRRAARERRILRTATAIALAAVAIAGLAVWGWIEKNNLDQKTAEATSLAAETNSLGLASSAATDLASRPDVAMLLMLAAHHASPHGLLMLAAHHASPHGPAEQSLLAAFEAAQRDGVIGILHGHTDAVDGLALDPAGRFLASASADGTTRLWSLAAHHELGPPLPQGGLVFSVAVDGSGTRVASGGFGQIRLWNARTYRLEATLAVDPAGAVTALAFRPKHDQILAVGSLSGALELRNLATQSVITVHAGVGPIRRVAFSPDGGTLAAAGNGGVQLFDAATGQALSGAAEDLERGTKYALAVSPSGTMLATGGTGMITFWTRTPLRPVASIQANTGIVYSMAFASDHLLVSGGGDGTVRLWDVSKHREVGTPLIGHVGAVQSVAVAPRAATLASASADDTIRLWSIPIAEGATQGASNNIRVLTVHDAVVLGVAFSRDGRKIVSGDVNGVIDVSDVMTGRLLASRKEPEPVLGVAFSSDGRSVAAGEGHGRIALWSPFAGQYTLLKTPDRFRVISVAFDPTGKILASGGADRIVHLWDVARRDPSPRTLTGHTGPIYSVAFSPSGALLASGGDDRTVRMWDVTRAREVGAPMVHPNAVFSVTFSPDGQELATGAADGLRLWNARTDHEIGQPLRGQTSLVRSVAFSPDGRLVASGGSDGTIRLWDVAGASQLGAPLTGSQGSVETVAFSPDGTLATSGGDGAVRLWGTVSTPAYGRLEQSVCRFLGGGLSRAEWAVYASDFSYRPTCAGSAANGG